MPLQPDDPVLPLRRQLAAEIVRALGPNSEYTVAPRFGVPQPRFSELNRGVVGRFSLEWLIRRIHRMGGAVTISVAVGDVGRAWRRLRFAARRAALDANPKSGNFR